MINQKREIELDPKSPKDRMIILSILSFVSLISLAIFIYLCFSIKQSYESLTWDVCPVEKVIKETKTSSTNNDTKTTYSWTCYYTYQGQSYKTDKKGCGEFDSCRNTHELKHWQVYVNPKKPSEALLSQGVSLSSWLELILAGVFSFLWTFVLIRTLRLYKKQYWVKQPSPESRLRKDPSLSPWDK